MPDSLVSVVLGTVGCLLNLIMGKRLPDIEMNISLLLLDSGHNAYEVFLRCLHIFLSTGNQLFPNLHYVARFIFVRYAERNYIQFLEIGREILGSTHIQHLEKALLGGVYAVFGTALALCNPDRTLSTCNTGPYIL